MIIQRQILEQIPIYGKLFSRAKWPKFSADVFWGDNIGYYDFEDKSDFGVRFIVTKNLFDGGIAGRKMEQWKIRLNKLKAEIKCYEREYLEKLRLLHEKYKRAKLLFGNMSSKLKMEKGLFEMTQKNFDLQSIPLKQFSDAQDRFKQIENEYAQARIDLVRTKYLLRILLGETLYDPKPSLCVIKPKLGE